MRPEIRSLLALAALSTAGAQDNTTPGVVYEPKPGPGAGKHIVLIAGDEEYRSEQALPMLAKILAVRHGFRCTVLFSTDPKTGEIDPRNQTHLPGLRALATADMMVLFVRFRELPDADMKHLVDFVEAGKPILGIRTATHAFDYKRDKQSPFRRYGWRDADWPGGFGRQILGETWINHHGRHGKQSTRGVLEEAVAGHPMLRGVSDIWGPTDVYGIKHLGEDATVLVRGQVLSGMRPDTAPVEGAKNDPMMPLIWIREYRAPESGARGTAICSTIGASMDLESEGLRRVLVNACYWALGLADEIAERSDVDYVGPYEPTFFGVGRHERGVRPADLALDPEYAGGGGDRDGARDR